MYSDRELQKLFNITNMVPVRIPKGSAGQSVRLKVNGIDVTATYLNNLKEGSAIALLTDKGNWYLAGEEVQSPNQSTRRFIESRRTSLPPKKLSNKVKILFYIEQEATINFYIGGHIVTPRLIHTIDKAIIDINSIIGFVHNYGKKEEYTIQYTFLEHPTIRSKKCVIIQGNSELNEDDTDGINDKKYYLFNYYYNSDTFDRRPKYKGNAVWKSDETLVDYFNNTNGTYSVFYPNKTVIDFTEGFVDGNLFLSDINYSNFNIILNGTQLITNTGSTRARTSIDSAGNPAIYPKTVNSYLINENESLITDSFISSDLIKHVNCDGYKLLCGWKNAYITQSFNFSYQEYYFGNAIRVSPISLTASINYFLNNDTPLNSSNLGGLIISPTPLEINLGTTAIAINLDYFTTDWFTISLIDTSEFVGLPIILAKQDIGFVWYCKGTISSMIASGDVSLDPSEPTVQSTGVTCNIGLALASVQKVEYCSFASMNGSLLILNGSINSLLNSMSSSVRFTPSDFHVVEDVNMLGADCFYSDYRLGDITFKTDTSPLFFSYYPISRNALDYDYTTLNNLLSKSTCKGKIIYIANVLDEVKIKNSIAYIESWAIDDAGNFNLADKVLKEPAFSLKSSNANILSVSYYP